MNAVSEISAQILVYLENYIDLHHSVTDTFISKCKYKYN